MSSNRLGIGFIGSGFITRFHIQSMVGVREADVRGVWSPNNEHAEAAAAFARDLDVGAARAFASIEAMVADPAVDAGWLCGPNHTRVANIDAVCAALTAGATRRGVAGDFQLRIKQRAQLYPASEQLNLRRRQLRLGRHLVVAVAIRNHVELQTLLRLLEINGRPDFAALEQPRTTGEAEMPLERFLPTVALETVLLQNRVNLLVKKLNLRRGGQFLRR